MRNAKIETLADFIDRHDKIIEALCKIRSEGSTSVIRGNVGIDYTQAKNLIRQGAFFKDGVLCKPTRFVKID